MKNVLIIAYEFYPTNSGGSHRPFRIANFLKQHNITPFIIAADDDELKSKHDDSLAKALQEADLHPVLVPLKPENWYSKISKSYYINIVDDTYSRWKTALFETIDALLTQHKFEAIYITAPPFSNTKAVADLKDKYKLPVFLDLRDAWLLWNVSPYASKIHYALTKSNERKALESSHKNLVTSEVTIYDFTLTHPQIDTSKYLYIPNSFDVYLSPKTDQITIEPKDKIKIGYVGSFYFNPSSEALMNKPWYQKKPYQWFQFTPMKEEWIYRSPFFVFKSIHFFLQNNPSYRSKIELHFAGSKPAWFQEMIDDFGLNDIIIHHGSIPKGEVDTFQNQMDLLLLTSAKRTERKDYSIAGKTFEYFSQIKPILAFVTEGAQKDILSKSGLAIILDPDNTENTSDQLKNLIDHGLTLQPNYEWMDRFKTSNALQPLLNELNQL